ncbi:acid-sensing ion channel 1-like isoform X3 [Petromyzon marinus]|uniref:Acid-sensing ion channel 1-like isoform X3 n=1 Tax=Petromyzon marinus TaxID=7757 RepID=A0AAJ7SXE5_PETMA|nr:acid-sensing ion channel 1-like isoform X3 [Petromyzon marinus]XP_032807399.1 acid-sensing ion channel 1-like isoform X3 [Petromyzon marinus]XP_032807401.1 acid-sensing ion channel 1-like isoform X3 [Petromyzon marinus]XP_032807402.1 acid-sensing ion channel 1-like isoform X3 [Petromyzon marinus]
MDLKGARSEENVEMFGHSTLESFAGSSSLHGISHIFSPGRLSVRRFLWAFAFLGSLAFFVLECAERVQYFLEYPHVTKLDEMTAHLIVFPAVTFCNLNEFRFTRVTRNDLYHVGELLHLLNERMEIPNVHLAEAHVLAQLKERADFRTYKPRPFSMREFHERTGHELREMLLSCKYRGESCFQEDFQTVYTRYGKCYTFNSGKGGRPLLTTVKGGMGNGLEIMLDIQQEEYLPVWGENDETSFEAGIKVQIHSQDEPPLIDQLGFGVSPGFQTFVSCQEQRLIYLPPPWGDCKSTPISSDFFETYSITACRIDCETRYLVENCNCRMVHMPGDAPYCTPEQYTECARPVLDVLVKRDNDFCLCETPCNMTRYGKELSMVKIPSKASAKYLAKKYNKTEAYIAENVLVLDIFFEALNYETIEQKKAYEVAGLLGDIGGQMGLFIGASILTILEIFDYVYELIRDKILFYFRAKKKQKTESKDTSLPMTGPCEALRGHSESAGYAASMLPPPHHHHQHHALHHHAGGRPGYEDFTC